MVEKKKLSYEPGGGAGRSNRYQFTLSNSETVRPANGSPPERFAPNTNNRPPGEQNGPPGEPDPSVTVIEPSKHEREQLAPSVFCDRPSKSEVLARAQFVGLAEWKALDWFNEMEGCGWLDFHHRPIIKWQPVLDRVRVKWEADGRPSGPPAARQSTQTVNGSVQKRPLSPMDLTTIMKAKESEASALRAKHCSEVAMGSTWNNKKARSDYFKLKSEIKQLNHQLSNMA